MLLPILVIVFLLWVSLRRWQMRDMIKLANQLQCKYRAYPLIGHAYIFMGNDEDRMKVFQKLGSEAYSTGGLLSLWQGDKLYINVSDPSVAALVLKTCLEKDDVMRFSRMLTGNGIVFAPVPVWRPRRKVLAPTFSPRNLAQFSQIFTRQSNILVEQLQDKAGKGSFSLWKFITTYSMDSVCESTLGIKVNAQKQPDQPFLKAFEDICRMDSARLCRPWLHSDFVFRMMPYYPRHLECRKEIKGFVDEIIRAKRQSMEEEKRNIKSDNKEADQNPKSFLELLIESSAAGGGYSPLELREETVVLVLAGTDTSAVGTGFTALMLAQHQDVQETLYKEIQDLFGDSTRPLNVEDLPRLKYLDAVIKETLRLYPPVPVIVRKIQKDLVLPSGITLLKGCGVVINIWCVNRHPSWGEDAAIFDPQRFLDPARVPPDGLIAFSSGPRACIGYQYAMMSMKIAVTNLLRTYKLLPATPVVDKHAPLRVKFDIMMKSVDNFALKIEKRNK